MTASIAHEVNQPLSGIITNASTCLRMLDADPPNIEGALETARRTIRDGNRASENITRLRALFSNRQTTTESVDLNEATREVIAPHPSDGNVQIGTESSPPRPEFRYVDAAVRSNFRSLQRTSQKVSQFPAMLLAARAELGK